ncbi:TetR/AcrR family transcriptional regulator [Novosphingobium terrae]|uniref:TetR/AcrR family transcriptional regulator n=1 Tax=Novosphingobium terrae TaxID=2726189 RepID=UPI001F1319AE|nr:TetR/AcrR family transcriptional regulator [Novosphingobium terrae]
MPDLVPDPIPQDHDGERGRGRPRDPRKDIAIRDAAWEVLADKGYEGLTFEAVAEIAGCSRSTLYRRFASKNELIAAMLYETSREVEPELPEGTPPRAMLLAHVDAFIAYMSGKRGRGIVSLTEAIARSPELQAMTQAHKRNEREYYFIAFRGLVPGLSETHMSFVFDTLVGMILHHTAVEPRDLAREQRIALVDSIIYLLGHPLNAATAT